MNDQQAQTRIQHEVDRLVSSGAEVGLQVAVIKNGRMVVDAVSGLADPRTGAQVSADTLFFAASTAKGVASSLAHVLVERGELDYDMRVIDVWPEFGAHGKADVTLRHVLLHTAGVPGVPADTTVANLCDWEHMCAVIAAEQPWWKPGTRYGYHAKTFGFLIGETNPPCDWTDDLEHVGRSARRPARRARASPLRRPALAAPARGTTDPARRTALQTHRSQGRRWTARCRQASDRTPSTPTTRMRSRPRSPPTAR